MKLASSKTSLFWMASILLVAPFGCTTTPSQEDSSASAGGETAEVEAPNGEAAPTSDDVTLDAASEKDGTAPAADAATSSADPATDAAAAPAADSVAASGDSNALATPASEAAPSTVDATAPVAAAPETPAGDAVAEQKLQAAEPAQADEGAALTEQPSDAENAGTSVAAVESKSAPAAVAQAAVATSTTASDADDSLRLQRLYGNRLFGQSRVQLGVNQPTFNENQKGYETLYGKAKAYPTVMVDWFPLDWRVNPGLSINLGGYSVGGMASKKTADDSIVPDEKSRTNLLFIPIQGSIKVEMTPFRQKWVVFDGWVGYEYGWWQETTSTATTTSSIPAWHMATGDTSSDTTKPTSKGVKYASVMGASANILLNSLDERTVRSMISTMGISHVYMSPFFEIVKTTNPSGLTFGRNVYGVGFTFETLR